MNARQLATLLEAILESPELERDVLDVAERHGVKVGSGELTDGELEKVAGGYDPRTALMEMIDKLRAVGGIY